jgi:hypothetical protein
LIAPVVLSWARHATERISNNTVAKVVFMSVMAVPLDIHDTTNRLAPTSIVASG